MGNPIKSGLVLLMERSEKHYEMIMAPVKEGMLAREQAVIDRLYSYLQSQPTAPPPKQ